MYYIIPEGALARRIYVYLEKQPRSLVARQKLQKLADAYKFSDRVFFEACEQLDRTVTIGKTYKPDRQWYYAWYPFDSDEVRERVAHLESF